MLTLILQASVPISGNNSCSGPNHVKAHALYRLSSKKYGEMAEIPALPTQPGAHAARPLAFNKLAKYPGDSHQLLSCAMKRVVSNTISNINAPLRNISTYRVAGSKGASAMCMKYS